MILPLALGGIAAILLVAKAAKGKPDGGAHGSSETIIPTQQGEQWELRGSTNIPPNMVDYAVAKIPFEVGGAFKILDGPDIQEGSSGRNRFTVTLEVVQPIPITLGRVDIGPLYVTVTQASKLR